MAGTSSRGLVGGTIPASGTASCAVPHAEAWRVIQKKLKSARIFLRITLGFTMNYKLPILQEYLLLDFQTKRLISQYKAELV